MFERLQEVLQQMKSAIGAEAILLRSDDLPIIPMGLEHQVQRFGVVVSQPFKVLLLGVQLESEAPTSDDTQPILYQVGLTFEPEEIASFLDELTQRLNHHPIVFNSFERLLASCQPNDPAIQSEFTLLLLEVLAVSETSHPVPPEPIYPYVSVCQPIENALHQQVEQERLINQVTTQIRQSLELPVILTTAVEQVRHFLKVDRLLIYQFDFQPTSSSIHPEIGEGEDKERNLPLFSTPQPLTSQLGWGCVTYEARVSDRILSVLNWMEEQECAIHVPNCREKYRQGLAVAIDDAIVSYRHSPCLLELMQQTQVRAKLVAPIVVQNQLWGLLIAHQCLELRRWQDTEKAFLKEIAEHLAVAIYQAQLYAQLQQQKTTLELRVIERTQELRDALQAAQAASLAKSEFLAAISHELRTPLTCVIGMSATLLRWSFGEGGAKTVPINKQRQFLKMIQENGQHLLELINDILDLSQVEAGKAVLNISEFSLTKLTHQTLRILQEKAFLQKIELEMDCQVKPQSDRFRADQRRVKQILYNLLGNAIKFTPEGGRVILRVWRESHLAFFQVEDTGIGIARDQLPLLFQKFQQLESTYHRKYEGTGLGLALTKQLVELHGGTIEVESVVDEGSVFTVCLPIQPPMPPASDKQQATLEPSVQPQGSIVLVNNHEATATMICDILTAAGYHVVWLMDSSAALQQIQLLAPQVVIVDWQLPAMDGYEIGQYLHNSPSSQQIKVLALTTPNLSAEEEQDMIAIVDGYLLKPIEPVQLLDKVTALMAT